MAEARTPYKRLPGRRAGIVSRDSLWLGPDHVLAVHSLRFTEYYRRFYFRDIQAICLLRRRRNPFGIVDGVMSIVAILVAAIVAREHPVFASFCIVALLFYLAARGLRPSSETWIQTAIGAERLPSLRRFRTAKRALALLEPRILEAQAGIEAAAPANEPAAPPLAAEVPAPPPATLFVEALPPPLPDPAPAIAGPRSLLALFTFIIVLLSGILKAASANVSWTAVDWILPIAYALCVLLATAALLWGPKARGNQLAALVSTLIICGYIGMLSLTFFSQPFSTPDENQKQLERVLRETTSLAGVSYFIGALLISLAIWGLIAYRGIWLSGQPRSAPKLGLLDTNRP